MPAPPAWKLLMFRGGAGGFACRSGCAGLLPRTASGGRSVTCRFPGARYNRPIQFGEAEPAQTLTKAVAKGSGFSPQPGAILKSAGGPNDALASLLPFRPPLHLVMCRLGGNFRRLGRLRGEPLR